jgi:hypothetical protein
MIATFPAYAVLLQDGFGVKRKSGVARTEFDDGMTKQLQTKSRVKVARTVKYGLKTLANYQAFITFFQTTIHFGADWFNWVDPVDGVTKLAQIVTELGEEKPDTPLLDFWAVSFTIETWSNG